MLNKLQNVTKDFDLFSRQIGLHMNKTNFYKTSFGGFCSILVFIFIIAFFWSRIDSFYNKDEIKVIRNRIFNPNPPVSDLSTDRFMFALNIDQPNHDFVTHPFFNVTVKQVILESVSNKKVRKEININLEPCTLNHWNQMTLALSNFTSLFQPFGLDFLCPVLNQKLELQGMWGSDRFSFIEVKVIPCKSPNDPQNKWNPTCAPIDEVNAYTDQVGFHGLNFYHSNYVLNEDQPSNYFTPYINDKLYFMFVPNRQAQNCDIYFQDIEVITDQSLLPTSDNIDIKILTQENNDVRETTQLYRKDEEYVTLTLRLSPYVSIINRSYKKVSQLMSELGGFIQIVITFVGILISRYNNFQFTVDLANNLYQLDLSQTNRKKDKSKDMKKSQKLGQSHSKEQNSLFFKGSKVCNESQNQNDLFSSLNMNFVSNNNHNNINNNNNNINNNSIHNNNNNNNYKIQAINNNTNTQNQGNKHNERLKSLSQNNSHIENQNDNLQVIPQNKKTIKTNELTMNQSSQYVKQSSYNNQISKSIQNQNQFNQINQIDDQLRPIDKFKRAVDKIRNKNKIFLDYIENEKNNPIQRQSISNNQDKDEKKNYLLCQFNNMLQKNNKFQVGIKYFLYKFSIGKLFDNEYNKYITKATEMIHMDLDICNILDKLQQIDKIKSVVFNKNQQILFNFYQKPKIQLDEQKQPFTKFELQKLAAHKSVPTCKRPKSQNSGLLSLKKNYDSLNSYQQIYNSYLALTYDQSSSHNTQKINQRLVAFLGPELLNIFFQSQFLDSNQFKISQMMEQRKRANLKSQYPSSISKQNSIKQLPSVLQTKKRETLPSTIDRMPSVITNNFNRDYNAKQNTSLNELSFINNQDQTQTEKTLLKLLNQQNVINLNQINTSGQRFSVNKVDSLNQQFSFHINEDDICSENECPDLEPQIQNIHEQECKIISSSKSKLNTPTQ